VLWRRHGEELDQLRQTQFGHGIDSLTEVEALQLSRQQSLAAIENFLAKAAIEARSHGLVPAIEP